LSDKHTDKLRVVILVMWQRWRSHHWIRYIRIPHAARKHDGSNLF